MLEEFWISELADRTGVSTRTIRYYIEEGLLPQPEVRGKYAVFTTEYLLRLRLIKILKDTYLPLKEIKALLDTLDSAQISEYLDKYDRDPAGTLASLQLLPARSQAPVIKESALEYITRLRSKTEDDHLSRTVNPQTSASGTVHTQVKTKKETWLRIEIKPGIELHVRQPLTSKDQQLIDLLLRVIQK